MGTTGGNEAEMPNENWKLCRSYDICIVSARLNMSKSVMIRLYKFLQQTLIQNISRESM